MAPRVKVKVKVKGYEMVLVKAPTPYPGPLLNYSETDILFGSDYIFQRLVVETVF